MNINDSLLHQVAARFIKGHDVKIDIKGTPIQLETLQDLLITSRDLMTELNKKNADVDNIIELTTKKKELTKKFQNISGITWKL